jgi:hypothetical protein
MAGIREATATGASRCGVEQKREPDDVVRLPSYCSFMLSPRTLPKENGAS